MLAISIVGARADATWNITSSDLSTDSWTAMAENTPDAVTALGSYTAYYKTESVVLSSDGTLEIRFKYASGKQKLEILGTDLLDDSNNVVASDYHYGYTGTNMAKNTYLLNAVSAGTYTLRYIINGNGISNSNGNITTNTIKYADSFANISQWYVVRIHANQAHYMYYDSSNATTGISFTSSKTDINTDNYLWGFVKNGNGVSIYNKAAGSSLAVDNATPSTMSADGTSVAFQLGTVDAGLYGWDADAFFAVYHTAGTYFNYQGDKINRWSDTDAGSTFMIYEVNASTTPLSYTLTDVNGATYTGSYSGFAGMTEPALTGCVGYTLSDVSWSGTTCSATINFPFSISSNGVENYTYIGSFHNKEGYSSENFLWHANGTNVIVHGSASDDGAAIPNNTDYQTYEWAIIPAISDLNITFTIKNRSTGKYITSSATSHAHNEGTVTLTDTATSMTYETGSTNKCGTTYMWKIPTGSNLYLSINSVNDKGDKYVGVWEASSTHDGLSVGYYTPADFATLVTKLTAACTAFTPYSDRIGLGLGQYTGETASEMSAAYLAATTATKLTATQLSSYISTLENPATKLTLNLPAANAFYRIKAGVSGKYITGNPSSYYSFLALSDTPDNSTIIYLDGNKLLNYSKGLYSASTSQQAAAGGTGDAFTFAESANRLGYYTIYSTTKSQYMYDSGNTAGRGCVDRQSGLGGNNTDWTIESVTSLPVTVNSIGGRGFASFYTPVDIASLPSGVKAYIATLTSTRVLFTEITSIPAGTAVVLYMPTCAESTEVSLPIGTASASTDGNVLRGAAAAAALGEQEEVLTMQNGANGVGFYKYNGENLAGFKAYINVSDIPSGIKGFAFDFEDAADGIETIEHSPMASEQSICNVAGQRLSKMQKGINIVNGKKVIVK